MNKDQSSGVDGGDAPPLTDAQIKAIALQWFTTGENQLRADGYYYRSLGTVTNVRESDLIAFAREVLTWAQAWPAIRAAVARGVDASGGGQL